MLLLLHKGLVFFVTISIHDSPCYACILHLITVLIFCFETWSEGMLLHLFCGLPTDYQMALVRSLISRLKMSEILSEVVRNL